MRRPEIGQKGIVGILGGMGPLASAAFVQTIYRQFRGEAEQEAPIVLLNSNPKVSDRTTTFLNGGDSQKLLDELENGLRNLVELGATQLIICCITAHYLVPKLPFNLRLRLTSLVDVVIQEIRHTHGACLLACTTGTRKLGLFQQHPEWLEVTERICFPTDIEQEALHEAIYSVKRDHVLDPLLEVLINICCAHGVKNLISGCTELHLLSALHAGANQLNEAINIIDPLETIARRLREELYEATVCA